MDQKSSSSPSWPDAAPAAAQQLVRSASWKKQRSHIQRQCDSVNFGFHFHIPTGGLASRGASGLSCPCRDRKGRTSGMASMTAPYRFRPPLGAQSSCPPCPLAVLRFPAGPVSLRLAVPSVSLCSVPPCFSPLVYHRYTSIHVHTTYIYTHIS